MPASRTFDCRLRCILSLIVLSRTWLLHFERPTGRSLLRCPRQSDTTRSVARVRVVSHAGAFQGFRAVVGFAKGNPGEAHPSRDSRPVPDRPFLDVQSQNRLLNLASNLPLPPLRC